ncbi:MAG: sensory rhodopsin transducer [Bdellovibrionota bacterium]
MSRPVGKTLWAIAEGYIPANTQGETDPRFISHETACILNAGEKDAHVRIWVYFSDRAPCGPFLETVPAGRTRHIRFNDLKDPEVIPREKDYSSVIESDLPIVVQYTRLDSRRNHLALLSTIAFAA